MSQMQVGDNVWSNYQRQQRDPCPVNEEELRAQGHVIYHIDDPDPDTQKKEGSG